VKTFTFLAGMLATVALLLHYIFAVATFKAQGEDEVLCPRQGLMPGFSSPQPMTQSNS